MNNKNQSGEPPLFPLYVEGMSFFQSLVLVAIIFAQLMVMYLIQNICQNSGAWGTGVLLLIISLIVSSTAVITYSRHLKRTITKKKK